MTPARPPLWAVGLLSAAALTYEVLLLRLFAIIQWHHFAYLAISVALLGIGAAGTFVTLARARLLAWYPASFAGAAAAFALASVACFAAAQRVSFNALEIAWNPAEFGGLAAIYLLLCLPFFCAATALCIAYARCSEQVARLYGADILGAGLGSLGLLLALFLLPPAEVLRAILALGLLAAALGAWPRLRRVAVVCALAAIVLPGLLPAKALELVASDYKDLRQALRVEGARVVAERSSPLGVVTAVASSLAPLRHAPGLALNAGQGPPEQVSLFVDGQAAGAVTHFTAGDFAPLAYLRDMTSALPYALLAEPRVLVLGAGGSGDVLQALVHSAHSVDAVELDAQLAALVQEDLGAFSGRPYALPGVQLHIAEARSFVAASRERYDLIQVALLDAFGSSAAGLGALNESHLYTVEALAAYLDHLAPNGLLAFTRWVALPPRDSLRLFSTAIAALEQRGAVPDTSLLLIRGWSTATLLVKNGAFTTPEIATAREFCRARGFDIAYFPGIAAADANSYNQLAVDDFFAGAQALLGPGRADFIDRYKFDLSPPSDDRPYFFHFFKWRTLPEFWQLRDAGALPPLDWGYPVLVLALLQAVPVSALLILLPLAFATTRHTFGTAPPALRRNVPGYFGALGVGFMALEIPLLQRFTLFLGHPAIAAAVVLGAFLVCAGLGARFAARLAPGTRWPFAAIGALALAHAWGLPPLLDALMALAPHWKILLTLLLVAPLAFCLGMPFPLGLTAVARGAAPLVPWAWGINGFASVVATLLATLLVIHWGQTSVILLAVMLYALAAWQFPQAGGQPQRA